VTPRPKNIYGVTKLAAEYLCELFHLRDQLPCIVLRTSRFFPEEDDDRTVRQTYPNDNTKVNELLHRRVDIEDAASAHLLALERVEAVGFGVYIVSASSPFSRGDLAELRADAPAVLRRHVPAYEQEYARRGWSLFPALDRVYVNERACTELRWQPRYDFKASAAAAPPLNPPAPSARVTRTPSGGQRDGTILATTGMPLDGGLHTQWTEREPPGSGWFANSAPTSTESKR
jgi:UDP-glucose 4-epimerase